ncbi:Hit1p ASCRUDRAFT_75948 [Ascoidea rubescens DSM 1968]|uniref:HIT-type domain-containing protein n=1 Tax=Ascoidea rubescens DSM 1968 TaxID=1344418 RepID=A0A1D2VI83_9ASCO|nr:hypothetical protein ASCRUDRAFT_75948 [Ascoidea rubescens DSM 1968]ODV61250.1 hypothetical protein ASCRUDRAFT_75948 [Ascoidea rubescens DSM 1968]
MIFKSKCEICTKEISKYKCPKCQIEYCSLACYKSTAHTHLEDSKVGGNQIKKELQKVDGPINSSDQLYLENCEKISNNKSVYQKILQDEKIQYYLKLPQLQVHLLIIFKIMNEISLTNEYNSGNRKEIASRKLNSLRIAGIEENELVEEFCQCFLSLYHKFLHS